MLPRPFARTMRLARLAIGVFVLLCTGVATADAPLRLHGLTIPDRVAGLPHEAPYDYEQKYPGLGHSVQFVRPGWRIDVYIYDAQLKSIPENPQSALVKGQLEGARRDILAMQERGLYSEVEVKREYTIERNGRTRFVCSALTFRHNRMNADVDSYVCVSSWNNKFIKIRMSTARRDATTSADAQTFVEAWSDLLWPST
jgi:hypothetical protein